MRDRNSKEKIKNELRFSENNVIPALKIGRFAIDEKYSGKGLGSHVLRNVLLSILNISNTKVGLRFITVDAYAISVNFYLKHNHFRTRLSDKQNIQKIEEIKKREPERQFNLHLDLKDIKLNENELNEIKSTV